MTSDLEVELVEIASVREELERGGVDAFADRLTAAERTYCGSVRHGAASIAARLAAKRAVLRLLGAPDETCRCLEVEIVRDPDTGRPSAVTLGTLREAHPESTRVEISLTHAAGLAGAAAALPRPLDDTLGRTAVSAPSEALRGPSRPG